MYRKPEPITQPKLDQVPARRIPILKCSPRKFIHGDKLPPAVYQLILSSPTPLIFSWSALAASNPPTNFPNNMSWIEGSSQEWIGCDRRTGRVCLNADPYRATTMSEPQTQQHSTNDESSEVTTQWTFHGYSAGSEPFRSFLDAGLTPLDRDPDIIWVCENNIYRAWRISTAAVADEVIPDLVVLDGSSSGPTMTMWEYEAAVL
ncbi:MAG: hypothetical protein Q9193_005587, partial [Seirophora villosa]